MSPDINLSIILKKEVYEKTEKIFYKTGFSVNTAYYMMLQETGEYNKIPFEITTLDEVEKLQKLDIKEDDENYINLLMDTDVNDDLYEKVDRILKEAGLDFNKYFSIMFLETFKKGEVAFPIRYAEDVSQEELDYLDKLVEESGVHVNW